MHKWRKSSFSGESNCVEVSWRKSSFSQIDCVEVNWHKSSFSGVNGCVEVADSSDEVLLRNSNHPDRGILAFRTDAVSSWIAGVKSNEFDYLA